MDNLFRSIFLHSSSLLYDGLRPLIFTRSAHQAHEDVLKLLARLDRLPVHPTLYRLIFPKMPVKTGGVHLPHPAILAAGFVKGAGFHNEQHAIDAVAKGQNIIPGWRTMPALVGPVEFGSYTRWPRKGNFGTVIWRNAATRSTQNRVGLKNPGARAAAMFLAGRPLPAVFGVNIAVSPGVDDPEQEQQDVLESIAFFLDAGVKPSWFTLNLSCPNTEDDPGNHQTENRTRVLCSAVVKLLDGYDIPLWVKVSPELAETQYAVLMRVFEEVGIQAVIATNTLPRPAPDRSAHTAGIGGGRLHEKALCAVRALTQASNGMVNVIACGGIQDPLTYRHFTNYGVQAVQYWSALVYRGPFAAAYILNESQD